MGKINRPIPPEVYPRKRFFMALDKLLRHQVIWIFGPGGSRKTTLISSYLDARKIPCLWYRVEDGDKDPETQDFLLKTSLFPKMTAKMAGELTGLSTAGRILSTLNKEERLSDILWPEAEGEDAHNSFITTQHRLRRLIGHEKAIEHKEGRLTLNERHCWVDVWAFEWLLEQAEDEKRKGSKEKAIQFIEKALALYKGPFLADEAEQPWMISLRERLRSRFIRSLIWVGHYWQDRGRWKKAIEYYRRGLEIDDAAEELYQQLMICHQKLSRPTDALSVYNRCQRTLRAVLGVEPSENIEKIRRAILSNVKVQRRMEKQ